MVQQSLGMFEISTSQSVAHGAPYSFMCLRGACGEHGGGVSAWDQAGTVGPQGLSRSHLPKISSLPGNSSLSSSTAFSHERKVIGAHCFEGSPFYEQSVPLKGKLPQKTLKAGRDFFIFAGPSWNIGSQCSTSSFKVISHADMNVITQSGEVP